MCVFPHSPDILPSCTAAGREGQVWGAPGRTCPPGSPPASGCDTPLTDTVGRLALTPPLSRPSAAPPPAGGGSVPQRDGGAPGRHSEPGRHARRACL